VCTLKLFSFYLSFADDSLKIAKRVAVLWHACEMLYFKHKHPFGDALFDLPPRRTRQQRNEIEAGRRRTHEGERRQDQPFESLYSVTPLDWNLPNHPAPSHEREPLVGPVFEQHEQASTSPPPMVHLGSMPGPPDPVHMRYRQRVSRFLADKI
jgi:hypothetical protein